MTVIMTVKIYDCIMTVKNRLPLGSMSLLHATKILDVQVIQPFFF